MARKKLDDQMVAEFIRLHERGQSYRSIGRKFGVNYRTVKSRIRKAGEEKDQVHWEAVSRQVDTKYLDEHYRMLMQMTSVVTEVVSADPIFTTLEQPSTAFRDMCIQSATQKATKLLAARGLELTSDRRIEDPQAKRLGCKLLDSLMDHEQLLKAAIEAWESEWINFQKMRSELAESAKNLFINAKASDIVAEDIKADIVNEVLRNKLLGEKPRSSRVNALDKRDKRVRNKHVRDRFELIRYIDKDPEWTVYTGSEEEVETARKIYDKVFSQLCHEERMRPIWDSYHSIMERVKEVEDYVDRLILIGRPQGQCSLCLNRQTPPPSSEG